MGIVAGPDDETCPNCGSKKSTKLVSKFARHRSEDDRVDAMADRLESMNEPDAGADMRNIVRELGKATDDDVSAELEEMFEADMEGTGED